MYSNLLLFYIFISQHPNMRSLIAVLFFSVALNTYAGSGGDGVASDTVSSQVSILTWNIKMLPRVAVHLKHHPVKRAHIIPGILLKESPDVIVFQEAYDRLAMKLIARQLRIMYPYQEGAQNRKGITFKRAGGVIIFSKYPMKELESIRYGWLEGIDKMAGKGALLVEINHPSKTFQVLGTHMEAGGSRELKISQYKDAGLLLKKHEKQGIPQFACGDFNTRRSDTILYPTLIKEIQAEDGNITGELQWTSDHLLNDMDSYSPTRRNLIDYVFCRPNGCVYLQTERRVMRYVTQWHKKHKDLSDHFAVLLRTKL